SLKAALARPGASVALQQSVHRNNDGDAAVRRHTKSPFAFPAPSEGRIRAVGIGGDDDGRASSVDFVIGAVALPTVPRVGGAGLMRIRGHFYVYAKRGVLTKAAIAVPSAPEGGIRRMCICRDCDRPACRSRQQKTVIALPTAS